MPGPTLGPQTWGLQASRQPSRAKVLTSDSLMRKPRLREVKNLPQVTQLAVETRVERHTITKNLQHWDLVCAQRLPVSECFPLHYLI